MNYSEFIKTKVQKHIQSGFSVLLESMNNMLFDWQKKAIQIALDKGRFAMFMDCGLGKTFMQLEWAFHVQKYTDQKVLILAPLAVVAQTKREAQKFNIDITNIDITNYEQLKNIDTSKYSGVVLDESSILKGRDGKLSRLIIDSFSGFKYKLACTATPSPNDHMELGQHSEFLGGMSYLEMLAMFFVHDAGQTQKWRLRKHAKDSFWKYVCQWSISLDDPCTIDPSQKGYNLPEIEYIEHFIPVENNTGTLFSDTAVSATDLHRDLKRSFDDRIKKTAELVNNSDKQWIIWTLRNNEADALQKLIDDSVNVQGSDKPEIKAKRLNGFANNEFKVLITKTSIASFGMNYQNCSNMVFTSYDFKFEAFYQAVRRSYRFGQKNKVDVHLMIPESQVNVRTTILKKQQKHKDMIREMAKYSRQSDYSSLEKYKATVESDTVIEETFKCLHGDCVERMRDVKDNEADMIIFSPPFADLYVYSDNPKDMGNVSNYDMFVDHFSYLIPELKRALKPGRVCAVHCMDLPIQKGKEGFIGLRDFSGMIQEMFTEHGFIYHARTTIWKNPVTEMQRTKALGLLHKTIKKDSSMSRVGIPDYILFFRNEGDNEIPISHQDTDPSSPDYLPVDLWQKYASPVWLDIDYGRTLQYRSARDNNDEKHICPLQLDTIERCLHLYSNEGETILSPFGGIGSEGYQALKMNRKSISIELKESYFNINVKNHKSAMMEKSQLLLF
jgi:DNA modification methylase